MNAYHLTSNGRQKAVTEWVESRFGVDVQTNVHERAMRFLEEAIELFQAADGKCTAEDAHKLVDYVFSRPVGHQAQEIGGVMVTLYALAEQLWYKVDNCEADEINRIYTLPKRHFQKRQAKKKEAGVCV